MYVRQSTLVQVERNTESAQRQYALRDRAVDLGWPAASVVVVDEDTGRSGASTDGRLGFKELVAEVGLGHVGLILALEVSRFARSSADWHQLIDLCALTRTLIADSDETFGDLADRDPGVLSDESQHLVVPLPRSRGAGTPTSGPLAAAGRVCALACRREPVPPVASATA